MDYYCDISKSTTQKGRAATTLPVVLFNEYHEYKQNTKTSTYIYRQKPAVALRELRRLASNRESWTVLAKNVCGTKAKPQEIAP